MHRAILVAAVAAAGMVAVGAYDNDADADGRNGGRRLWLRIHLINSVKLSKWMFIK